MSQASKHTNVHPLDRTNLRLPADTFAAIDSACAARVGNVSRTTWIAEAVQEKLARDMSALALYAEGRVANG